jgi:hypothetical protein
MKLLGLPGRKSSTYEPMIDLVGRLDLGQTETVVRRYGFWLAEDVENPDTGPEVDAVAASGADIVVAKSMGTLLTMLACERGGFAPRRCVFIGLPLRRLREFGRTDLIAAQCARAPTLFIQQSADFNGPHAELADLVAGRAIVEEVPGGDHVYGDLDLLARLIHSWWGDVSR